MKNLAKLFMAVVAGMAAFSCVTDATEDLGVNLEVNKSGAHEVTLSLEQSRTQLGEKADGIYPVYWSAGDAIAINGEVSYPLAAERSGEADATFSFKNEIAYPYYVVYPASAAVAVEEEGAEEPTAPVIPESVKPVHFLASQPYTEGTFAPQSAPMYAYAVEPAEGEPVLPVQLNHLAGALRFAIKGDVTLASMVVEAEAPIAGAFSVDCATGELTALEGATNSVTVTLPEGGLKLGAEATPIYVAVPAGKHGIYTVKLVSNDLTNNTMIVRFNSDYHPIAAGVVKEFGEVTFTPNADSGQEGELVIENVAQMKRLAQLSEVGQLGGITKVSLGATIDMSGVEWNSINLFPSIVFEGNSDKGYEIKGLTAPLFGVTGATIQNVKLTNVNIVETKEPLVGAIARSFYGAMTNCEAAGSLEVNNTTFTTTVSMSKYDIINIGGLVGQAGGATFKDCANKVNILVNSVSHAEQASTYVAIGGVVGAAHSLSSFDNTDNHGKVEICGGIAAPYVRMGGVLGYMISVGVATPEVTAVKNCDNHGELFMNDKILAENNVGKNIRIGGICNNLVADVEFINNNNHAEIHNDGYGATTVLGGIVGYRNLSPVVNCQNNANIYNTGRHTFLEIGGIVGEDVYAPITNCKNNAKKLYNTATKAANGVTDNANVYIGGITGANEPAKDAEDKAIDAAANAISDCYNYAEIEHTGDAKAIFLGGISARSVSVDIVNCHNSGAVKHLGSSTGNCYLAGIAGIQVHSLTSTTNSGAVVLGDGTNFPAASTVRLSGLANTVNGTMKSCKNSGSLTANGHHNVTITAMQVAGLAYYSYGNISDCENEANGDITLNNVKMADVHLAGLVTTPYLTAAATEDYVNNYNRGDITFNGCVGTFTGNTNCRIAGLVALTSSSSTHGDITTDNQVAWKNCANYGNINLNDFQPGPNSTTKYGRIVAAGCFATYYAGHYDLDNCDNHGEVKFNRLVSNCNLFIGGVVGYWGASSAIKNIDAYIKDCDNTKDIIVNTSAPATEQTGSGEGFMVGGVIAASYMNTDLGHTLTLTNLTNSGDVIVNGNYVGAGSSRNCIGGISGDYYTYGTLTNCVNSGDVKFVPDASSKSKVAPTFIGGVLGYSYPYVTGKGTTLTNGINTGAVEVANLKMNSSKYLFVGGVVGYEKARTNIYTYDNCGNSGEVKLSNITSATYVYAGGMYGFLEQSNASGKGTEFKGEQVNIGNLTIEGCNLTGTTMIGGIVGRTAVPISGAKLYCDIKALGWTKNLGVIEGMARADATKASNCGVGGNLILSQEEDVDASGDPILADLKTPIDLTHLYSTAIDAAVAEGDGCYLLTSKPSLPTVK